MSDRRRRSLGEVVQCLDALRQPVKASDRLPGPYPYYGASGIVDYVDGYLFDGEYVLVAEDGENLRTRRTPIAFLARGRFWVNNHAHVLVGTADADTRYIAYQLEVADVGGFLSGSTQPKLTQQALLSMSFDWPPIEQQRAVADVISALDDKKSVNEHLARQLFELAAAVLQRAFHEHQVQLAAVADVRKGLSYKGAGLAKSGTPMVNLANAAAFGGFKRSGWKYYTGDYKPRHITRRGDLLVANTEQTWRNEILGWPMLVPDDVDEALFSHHVSIIDFKPEWRHLRLPTWAYLFTTEARQRVEAFAHGTTVAALPAEALTGMEIPVLEPDDPLLEQADVLLSRAWTAERESEALAELRDALLPALMSERLRVREAEELVEEAV